MSVYSAVATAKSSIDAKTRRDAALTVFTATGGHEDMIFEVTKNVIHSEYFAKSLKTLTFASERACCLTTRRRITAEASSATAKRGPHASLVVLFAERDPLP